jgi:uncharacterized membrane protein
VTPAIRPRAWWVAILFAATVVLGLVLLFAFDTDVQTIDADELVRRKDDARAFFAGDYVFVVLYAVLSPIAIWRFGAALTGGSPPTWIKLSLLLTAGGVFDAIENALLLSSTGSASQDRVDAAHAVAIPKTIFFVAGAVVSITALVRAVRVLRTSGDFSGP